MKNLGLVKRSKCSKSKDPKSPRAYNNNFKSTTLTRKLKSQISPARTFLETAIGETKSRSLEDERPKFALVKKKKNNSKVTVCVKDIRHFQPKHCKDFDSRHQYMLAESDENEVEIFILLLGTTKDQVRSTGRRVCAPPLRFVTNTPPESKVCRKRKDNSSKAEVAKKKRLVKIMKKKLEVKKKSFDVVESDVESEGSQHLDDAPEAMMIKDGTKMDIDNDALFDDDNQTESIDNAVIIEDDTRNKINESEESQHMVDERSNDMDDVQPDAPEAMMIKECTKMDIYNDALFDDDYDDQTESIDNAVIIEDDTRNKINEYYEKKYRELKVKYNQLARSASDYRSKYWKLEKQIADKTCNCQETTPKRMFLEELNGNVYLGDGVEISESKWDVCLSQTNESKFTKTLAVCIWGTATLSMRSLDGKVGNRSQKSRETPARPPLTPKKILAIKGCMRYFSERKGKSTDYQDAAVKKVNHFLSEKMADARKSIFSKERSPSTE